MPTTNGILRVTYKGNNKITELRTIFQTKVKTHKYISQQPENCENRNDPYYDSEHTLKICSLILLKELRVL